MESPNESESSMDSGTMLPPSPVSREQLQKRIDSLTQQNKVLKAELDTFKTKCKVVQEENRSLKQASVIIQAKAEQEEEYISNTLLKKIQSLKKEKETLAHHYEREEECLTNDLSRKLDQLRQEKCKLEQTLEQEQECLVNKLMRRIEKLQAETENKQTTLEQLRREMVELENTLEQEQEALVNKLWKRMDKLEAEKRSLQIRLDQPVSDPTTPRDIAATNGDRASHLSSHIRDLRSEVLRLRGSLETAEQKADLKCQQMALEEKSIREENRRLRLEVDRREALCRNLSESESSLEMEDSDRFGNDGSTTPRHRPNTQSPAAGAGRPLSPGLSGQTNRCHACGQIVNRRTSDRFAKPALPSTMTAGLSPSALSVHCAQGGGQGGSSTAAPLFSASGNVFLNFGTERLSFGNRIGQTFIAGGGPYSSISSTSAGGLLPASVNFGNLNADGSGGGSTASLPSFTSQSTSQTTATVFTQPASPMDTTSSKE